MSVVTAAWTKWAPTFHSVLRIVAGGLFILHGTTKLFAWPASIMPNGGVIGLNNIAGVGGLIEVILGPFLLVGLFTRPVAFILCGEMAVAYFKAHFPRGMWPILNGGEVPVLYCFLWLYFSAAGGGPISLDALRGKKSG
jgi:putative oxidoreductase